MSIDELLERLEAVYQGDHERGCDGRCYTCECGFDEETCKAAEEAAATIRALREALEFYGDETAWNQPPIKTVHHELLGPAYENQASKVRLDRGRKARAALDASHGMEG